MPVDACPRIAACPRIGPVRCLSPYRSRAAGLGINLTINAHRGELHPALGNFIGRPCHGGAWIDVEHRMNVVAHHRIGIHADGKDLRQRQ